MPRVGKDKHKAKLCNLYIRVKEEGNLYIADYGNNRVRMVTGGNISTVAGNGAASFGGDNGPATSAQLNGPSGAFVQPYVVAHEYGHHIQNVLGTMNQVKTQQGPNSDSVRLELQADCYAGMWAKNATTTHDSQGNVLIQDLTDQDIQEAIAAAKSVGDDKIQKETGNPVDSEHWTHGSSDARVHWFTVGFQNGTLAACNTFNGQPVE